MVNLPPEVLRLCFEFPDISRMSVSLYRPLSRDLDICFGDHPPRNSYLHAQVKSKQANKQHQIKKLRNRSTNQQINEETHKQTNERTNKHIPFRYPDHSQIQPSTAPRTWLCQKPSRLHFEGRFGATVTS